MNKDLPKCKYINEAKCSKNEPDIQTCFGCLAYNFVDCSVNVFKIFGNFKIPLHLGFKMAENVTLIRQTLTSLSEIMDEINREQNGNKNDVVQEMRAAAELIDNTSNEMMKYIS